MQAAAFGWIVRGHVSFIDLEHVVAFGVGVAVAVGLTGVSKALMSAEPA